VQRKTKRPGWWTDKETKKILLADYRNALLSGKFVNRCLEALSECSQYVHLPGGKIEHSRAIATADPTASGENHGDMCFVPGTLIQTIDGEKPIERICVGDRVLTRCGYRSVAACGRTAESAIVWEVGLSTGRKLTGTGSHPVWVEGRGWVGLSSLTPSDRLVACQENTLHIQRLRQSCSTASGFTEGLSPSTSIYSDISGLTLLTKLLESARCMWKSGNFITAQFHKAVTSITNGESASSAVRGLLPTNTKSHTPARASAEPVFVLSVSKLPSPQPVYNLSVADCPEYFAEGVLVHNCIADALANRGIFELARMELEEKAKPTDPPVGSFGWRQELVKRQQANRPYEWGKFSRAG
jgi:hypothetical protein